MGWRAANEAVETAALDPAIAAVIAATDRVDAAILAGDAAGFAASFAPEAVVNHPGNGTIPAAMAVQGFAAGMIDYHSIHRDIDHAAVRPTGEVLLMGGETVTPRGNAGHAGRTCRRRFTEVWREIDGDWKLSLRQATYFEVK